jgi:O-antigen/teichoic acid export membrane protein
MYTVFDKTLLGIMSNKSDVAFYEYSYKIVNIPKILIGVIGTVMLPRACKLVSEGKVKEQKKYMNMSALFTAFLGMGSIFGLCAIAPLFARVYYGESFAVCGNIIIALSPTIYIVGAGSVLRCQYLIPNGFDKQFNLSIVYNAVINLCISMLLIPRFGVYGAVIGTLSAEIFGLLYQTFLSRKFIDLKEICYTLIPFVIIGMIMFIIIKFAALYLNNDIGGLIIEVFIGIGIYCSLSILYICFFRKDVLIMIKGMRD